jgi:spore photoproduct lyase
MSKLEEFKKSKIWETLLEKNRVFIENKSDELNLSFQDLKQIIDIARDFESWDEVAISDLEFNYNENLTQKQNKQGYIKSLRMVWEDLKNKPNDYSSFQPHSDFQTPKVEFLKEDENRKVLGDCPVASPKTRCCNLQTLDAVINCGYDCSYCSIQSFYSGGKVLFDNTLSAKLKELELDPTKRYHIGTGQSSDSLLWGNREGVLETVVNFARENSNIVLELKTKSNNISWLIENSYPKNVITTWSINPQTIIDNEEHLTVSLRERLKAAEAIANKGRLVGFHFHPMIIFEGWQEEYGAIFREIQERFSQKQVALISFGTLTFIKPVLKKLRNRDFKTKILQMPLVNAEGKFSYPYETKKEMFSFAYQQFKNWHKSVYFYMCMEDLKLWKDVFGREYDNNDQFEEDMIKTYFKKIEEL